VLLLDANVLIALHLPAHVHNRAALDWFGGLDEGFATCPITQGTLVRELVRHSLPVALIRDLLTAIAAHSRHEFWPDDLSYLDVSLAGVVGHRQVTDAYLVARARARGARVATFDQGLAAAHPGVVVAVPTG
jgi:toxin-antitoxin system PIN domain toxin